MKSLSSLSSDPLVFDLDGDGIETRGLDIANPILFDNNAEGIQNPTGWIRPDDGLLVLDRNGNGATDNGRELFGDATPLNGNGSMDLSAGIAANGFAALDKEDTNRDSRVNANDARWGNLRVWRDTNQDGISQAAELSALASLGIASIATQATAVNQNLPDGNVLLQAGSYTCADMSTGTSREFGDEAPDANLELLPRLTSRCRHGNASRSVPTTFGECV